MNEVLFISDVGPTTDYTGGLVLHNIARALSHHLKADWVLLHHQDLGDYKLSSFNSQSDFYLIKKPAENWSEGKYIFGFNSLGEKIAEIDFEKLWSKINEIVLSQSYSRIIIVLQGQTTFRIAEKLQDAQVEFSTLNWDPWIWWALEKNVPTSFNQKVENVYRNLSTGKHMVPTLEFAIRYNIPMKGVVTLYPHISQHYSKDELRNLNGSTFEERTSINLAFAGQIYAKREFSLLLSELSSVNWQIAGRPVCLHYFGNSLKVDDPHVVNHGWVEPSSLIHELSKLDIGVLTYPGFKSLSEVSNLSFPSKFATYCAAGIPTVYIGPPNTPVSRMIQEDARFEDPQNEQKLVAAIEFCMHERNKLSAVVRETYVAYFSEEAFLKSLAQVFSLEGFTSSRDVFSQDFHVSELREIYFKNYSHLTCKAISLRNYFRWMRAVAGKFKRIFKRMLVLLISLALFFIMFIKSKLS